MIIESLSLTNFRQFTETQTIYFSTDENKKVTIVMAESGVGKTTLIQSFQWVLYGKCKYTKILNESIKNSLLPSHAENVIVEVTIRHSNKKYVIKRKQTFRKINVKVDADDSMLIIDYTDDYGVAKQVRGRDATILVKELMHQDLFPYFFLEGESLTKVGEQMARGKSGSNSDFVKAIKGLLGFNHLYEALKHLNTVSADYNNDIAKNTSSEKLKEIIKNMNFCDDEIQKANDRIKTIKDELEYNTEKRDELSEKLMAFGEIEAKQKRTKVLANELAVLVGKINDRKKQIFKKFSLNGYLTIIGSMLSETKEVLKNSDSMDKGIPGMNADAVQFMLDNHKCICGEELIEGSEHWKMLQELLTFLPPNNIGFELDTFNNELKQIEKQKQYFEEDFIRERKLLSDDSKEYDSKIDELNELNKDISGVREDIGLLKSQEQGYNQKIVNLTFEKKEKENLINSKFALKKELEIQKAIYERLDQKTAKLQSYYTESEFLRNKINNAIAKKEKEKREKLAEAINEIFKNFYDEKITFNVDSNYGVQIKTDDQELSEDFTSGGQDVAVALAFIGAIIKLSGEKDNDPDTIDDEEQIECYPLVLDAPTSNFGMKQMESFSEIIPKITGQIIVFINDKDGPILMDKMKYTIGSTWSLTKEDTYHSKIVKGNF